MSCPWPMESLLGGRYQVAEHPVGRGSYGKVRVATDTLTGRVVAVKQQPIASKAAFREHRFFMWLRASANSSFSQGACRVLSLLDDFTDCGGSIWSSSCSQALIPRSPARAKYLYMVFPYMDSSLEHQFRSRRGHFDREVVLRWSRELVAGLTFLHSATIVHGDLTMANILLDSASSVRIADFGLAFSTNDSSDDRRGHCTAYTRSPEVLLAADNPAFPVDIWALGVVVLTLLCGSRLFVPRDADGDEGAQVLEAQVEVLGTPQDWPAMQSLRLFAKYREVLERPPRHCSPEAFLADSAVATCPLLPGDPGVAFALSCLRFNPALRPSAGQLQAHDWLKEASVDSLRLLLLRMPRAGLEDVVLRLATGEMPARLSMVHAHCHLQASLPPPSVEERCTPRSQSSVTESVPQSSGRCNQTPRLPKDAGASCCRCSGHCGWPACRRRRRGRLERCPGVVVRGGLCADCVCELASCEKPRNEIRGQRRWCAKHGGESSVGTKFYSNLYGLNWKFGTTWSSGLQVVVKLSYVLRRMVPEDIRAWREHCLHRGYGAKPGDPVCTSAFVDMVVVGLVKWPESVRRATSQPPWPTAPAEAAAHLREILRHANHRRMSVYHDQCTSGRGYSHTGLVWFAKRAGLLEESTRRGRKAQKTEVEELTLGKAGGTYKLCDTLQVAEAFFTKVLGAAPAVNWPRSGSEMRAFLSTMGDAFVLALGVSRDSYTVCGLVRKVALLFPDEWLDLFADDLPCAEWPAFAPFAQRSDLETLEAVGASPAHLRHVVGMHFLWLALWLCSAGGLPSVATAALLQESPGTLLSRAALRSVADSELVAPGMPFLVTGEA